MGLHERSLAIWIELHDDEGVAASRQYLGFCAWLSGDFARAESEGQQALAEFRRLGSLRDVTVSLVSLGAAALYRGDAELAGRRLDEALAIARRLGF